jgi:hypothetical protein
MSPYRVKSNVAKGAASNAYVTHSATTIVRLVTKRRTVRLLLRGLAITSTIIDTAGK